MVNGQSCTHSQIHKWFKGGQVNWLDYIFHKYEQVDKLLLFSFCVVLLFFFLFFFFRIGLVCVFCLDNHSYKYQIKSSRINMRRIYIQCGKITERPKEREIYIYKKKKIVHTYFIRANTIIRTIILWVERFILEIST